MTSMTCASAIWAKSWELVPIVSSRASLQPARSAWGVSMLTTVPSRLIATAERAVRPFCLIRAASMASRSFGVGSRFGATTSDLALSRVAVEPLLAIGSGFHVGG